MHFISIQIQPEFLPQFDRQAFLTRVRAAGRSPEIDEFEEKGKRYLQFTFFTENPRLLWQDLQAALYRNSEYRSIISPISIAVCESEPEGKHANHDFLLLHHFDSSEKLDQLS
ncbi:MAG TPA: hypothetical protein VN030_09855 [Cellvibrio sp.]|nr:hypothetical protein [Cellvibrio sp.]